MEQLKCPNCGGNVDRERMICPYCGTQFKRENDQSILRIETYNPRMEVLGGTVMLDDRFVDMVGIEDASQMVINELAKKVADSIAPFMEVQTTPDFERCGVMVSARVRILRPDYRF